MSKRTKKLSLKRETLRQLDSLTDAQLGGVAGCTVMYNGGNLMLTAIRPPLTGTCGCDTSTCFGGIVNIWQP